ncbi:MAG: lytic transglycosylase domain-containing protein [Microbispora sp.]|nr:lytic transglycosylase domain-containing protein [Microbispora sp.]
MALEGVGNTIAEKVAPRITPLLNRTADWIADNKELASGYVTLASVIGITLLPAVSRLALSFAGIGSVLAAIKAFRVPVWLGTILGGAAVLGSIGATQGEAERNGERLSVLQAIKRWLEDRGVQFQIPSVRLPSALPPEVGRQVAAAAVRHGVNPDFATAIARNEGGTGRVSPAGAIGTMQLMPDTARDLGVNPYDQEQNIDGGVRYLRQLLNRFGGNQLAAAAAYNAGPNHPGVQRFAQTGDRSQLPSETKVYLSRLEAQGVRERGEVRVTVDLRNAPPGTIATAAATGSATVDRPRVATAMPGFAAP